MSRLASILDGLLSPNPGKRATERFWLLYTPVWGGITGLVMVGGFGERWGDLGLMLLGVGLGLGALVGPFFVRPPEERGIPLHETAAFKMGLGVVLLAFGLNYTQTPFFWDVLHMHYGFAATLTIDDNPVFLYFLTIAYFATYSVLTCIAFRALARRLEGTSPWVRYPLYLVAPFGMAFFETALNANPFTKSLFCYDDMQLMLWFGTLSYGVAFVYALPAWMSIDERPGVRVSALTVAAWLGAALYADLITLDVLRYRVAPHVTTVENDAHGLRDFGESCLEPPSNARAEAPSTNVP